MFIVTTLSDVELASLIKNKKISLDNGKLLFGADFDTVNNYFRERIGYPGYVIGLRGRLNNATAKLLTQLDAGILGSGRFLLEAEIDENDMLRYRVDGVATAADALYYGMTEDTVTEQLDDSQIQDPAQSGVEVLCVPYISGASKVRVTSLTEEVVLNVEGITFVKLKSGDE